MDRLGIQSTTKLGQVWVSNIVHIYGKEALDPLIKIADGAFGHSEKIFVFNAMPKRKYISISSYSRPYKYHQQFGGIFRMNLGFFKSVQIGNPALLESFLRHEPMHPKRMVIKPWKMYREYRGESYGLLTLDGQDWLDMRRIVQSKLMKLKEVSKMDVKINEVLEDFIAHISRVCDEHGKIDDLYFELNKLSYETICSVLYNERCGLLQDTCTEDALVFIKSVKKMMQYLGLLIVTSAEFHKQVNTRPWQNHTEAWDNIFETAKKYIDARLNSSTAKKDDLLTAICSDQLLTKKQLPGLLTDLQIGGVETTANSLLWLIFHLSRHSDVQEKLLEEIQNALSPMQSPTAYHLQQMPYLKSCIKESMRLTPTVPFTSRTLEDDTNLGGYVIPRGTIAMINFHAMTWNDDYFPDAQVYKPERWMKPRTTVNPFASTPFGIGKRMCVGQRLAELQLRLTLCSVIKDFQICATDNEPVKAICSGVMIPNRKLPVSLRKR
ncbi:1,25-dihydroxyvitamin D(3) 24-hydroxylase, mitochondrial-like [Pseudophryne corroboree]|uniref:1,25-dihydroxyvitamin D(3) 24-hydroxylase, mitochondrial-like n=1 Tax=Pseudophryne corroboree TaxID=495146 RepID=UPI003081C53B